MRICGGWLPADSNFCERDRLCKMISDRRELALSACHDLLTYGLWDAKTRAKRWVKKNILRRPADTEDLVFWPTGLLACGLWHCLQTAEPAVSREIAQSLADYFRRWEARRMPVLCLDDLLAGETFLAVYEACCDGSGPAGIAGERDAEKYREAVDRMAAYAAAYPRDEAGSFPYRAGQKNGHVYVDCIGLACPFLYEYGRYFGRDEYMELAVRQIANFLAYGMDGATGLPYHGYELRSTCKYGIVGWGRAVGWLLRGMAGCMTSAYGLERLREPYIALADAVLSYQRQDGYFSWQLQAAEGPADTSATAMICAALLRGMELQILRGADYEEALRAGESALEQSTRGGRVYDCSAECEGFGRYPQRYGAYPWALGPALMLY